jgi:hypothetical protein
VSRIELSGRMSLRRPKSPIKGGSAPEEEEEEYLCVLNDCHKKKTFISLSELKDWLL